MVKRIQCYEDASGKLHRDVFEAHKADLALTIGRSEDVSDTSARKLAERIAGSEDETAELIELLRAIQANRPEQPQPAAPAPARVYEDEAA